MSYRNLGKKALATVLTQEQNINVIEKYIFDKSSSAVSKFPDNEEKLETEYKNNLYQTIGDVMDGEKLKTILSNIKEDKIGWKHVKFQEYQLRMDEHDSFIENPFEVAEGALQCNKCKSKRVFYYQKQVRKADEPMTTFATCCACKNKWTYGG